LSAQIYSVSGEIFWPGVCVAVATAGEIGLMIESVVFYHNGSGAVLSGRARSEVIYGWLHGINFTLGN